jgi:hypothetical protein
MTDRPPMRHRIVSPLAHWELLIISLLLVAIYISRETGTLGSATLRVLDDAFAALALVLALHAAKVTSRIAVVHIVIAVAAIVIAAIEVMLTSESLIRMSNALSAYSVVVTAVLVFVVILRQRLVSADTLFGALAVYLAVAVLFGMVFTAIARTNPAAFEPAQQVIDGESSLYYFSFVTLTSLGYGDISPVSDAVRVLATLEAIIGVMLLAAVVGWVVGLLVTARTGASTDRRLDELAAAIEQLQPTNRPSRHGQAPSTGDPDGQTSELPNRPDSGTVHAPGVRR